MNEKAIVALILAIFLSVSVLGLSPVPGPYGDNARYIILARSVIQGKWLAKINFPDEPREKKIPPVYPLVLASLMLLFGYNMVILKLSSVVFMALALVIFYLFMRLIGISIAQRLIVFLLLAVNAVNMEYSREVLSEPIFLFFICSVAYMVSKYEKENSGTHLVAGLSLAITAFFLRDAAMLALIAIAVVLFRKRSTFFFRVTAGVILALGFSWLHKNLFTETGYLKEILREGSYLDPSPAGNFIGFTGMIKRYAYEAMVYAGDVLPDFVLPAFKNISPHSLFWPAKLLAAAGLFFLTGLGAYRLSKAFGVRFFLIYPAVYAACLPVFPSYGTRYLVPAGPFIILFLVYAISQITICRKKPVIACLLLCAVSANAIPAAGDIRFISNGYPGPWSDYYKAMDYIKQNTQDSAVIICQKPFLGYLLSGRKTLGHSWGKGPHEIFAVIKHSKAGYLILDSLDTAGYSGRRYLTPVIEAHKENFELVYKTGDPLTEVYKINR